MKYLHTLIHAPRSLLSATRHLAGQGLHKLREAWDALVRWHRHRLTTDPLYPVAITTGGGALISVFVTSAQVAHLLRTALQILAGGAAPRHSRSWEEEDHDWMG